MKIIFLKIELVSQSSPFLRTIFQTKKQTSIFLLQPWILKHCENRLFKAFFIAWCKHSLLSMGSCKMCLCTHNFANWLPKTLLPFLSERVKKFGTHFFFFWTLDFGFFIQQYFYQNHRNIFRNENSKIHFQSFLFSIISCLPSTTKSVANRERNIYFQKSSFEILNCLFQI